MRATIDNNLGKLYPNLAKEWHPTKNKGLTTYDVAPFSHKKVWWKCNQGHEWEAVIESRTEGRKCKKCYDKRRRTKFRKAS